jgi:hypothetical protein
VIRGNRRKIVKLESRWRRSDLVDEKCRVGSGHEMPRNKGSLARCQWLMPVILATWRLRFRESRFEASLGK